MPREPIVRHETIGVHWSGDDDESFLLTISPRCALAVYAALQSMFEGWAGDGTAEVQDPTRDALIHCAAVAESLIGSFALHKGLDPAVVASERATRQALLVRVHATCGGADAFSIEVRTGSVPPHLH